jgi:hypothetical protein
MPRDTLQYVIYPDNQKQLDELKKKAMLAGFKNLSQYLIFVGLNAQITVEVKECET